METLTPVKPKEKTSFKLPRVLFPKIIQIETTVLCNSACTFCPQNEMTRGPRFMEEWIWKKIVDQTRGRGITYRPFMINEPFVDPNLAKIIAYIKEDPTAIVEFNSNAHMTAKTDIEGIIAAGVDIVRFSIDGFTQETYNQSGRGGSLERMVNNVLKFIAERDRQGSSCHIEVRMINMDFNKHEREDFLKFWNEHADEAIITDLYEWPWTGQTTFEPKPCLKVVEEMFFMTDGQATLCCWDSHERGIIGDIRTHSVEEIWLGVKMQQYKQWLSKGERGNILLCSKCDAYKNHDFTDFEGY
ncbi:MAG: radical SAM/SPASM domain-containing protein [Fulvivirga sp.]